tara:strand:- start:1862 stop:2155 length:294 start_codon:yes stop_codon:yes gene_type:complete
MSELRADEREAHELGGFLYWYMIELSRPPMPEKFQVIVRDLITVGVQRWLEAAPYSVWEQDWDSLARRGQAALIQQALDGPEPDLDSWREEQSEKED